MLFEFDCQFVLQVVGSVAGSVDSLENVGYDLLGGFFGCFQLKLGCQDFSKFAFFHL